MSCIFFPGIKLDSPPIQDAIDKIERLIKKRESSYIVTLTAAHNVLSQKDEEFKEVYDCASLIPCNSMPFIRVAKIIDFLPKESMTGQISSFKSIFSEELCDFSIRSKRASS